MDKKEYIERAPLLAAYDAEHVGPPGRARELIASAPAADVRPVEWTPVTEKWPKKGKYVLVRFPNNDMAVACVFEHDEDWLFWRAMTDEGWTCDCDSEPTHWMPLPEPPKEASGDE